MKLKIVLAAFLALAAAQATGGEANPTPTSTRDDDDTPVYVFIPLADSYNMSTRWLGDMRRVYMEIFRSEASYRLPNARTVANNVLLLSDPYKHEMDDIVANAVEKDRACVEKPTTLGTQVLSSMDDDLRKCINSLVDLIASYDVEMDKLFKKVSGQSEVDIYSKCLPTEPTLTKKTLERANSCFTKEYQLAMDTVYYPTGLEIFTLVTEMSRRFAKVESAADICGQDVVQKNDETLTKIIEDIGMCGAEPHSRQRRGLGKKLKKAWKKVRNGGKKLLNKFCSKKPCMLPPITIPIGK